MTEKQIQDNKHNMTINPNMKPTMEIQSWSSVTNSTRTHLAKFLQF